MKENPAFVFFLLKEIKASSCYDEQLCSLQTDSLTDKETRDSFTRQNRPVLHMSHLFMTFLSPMFVS